MKNLLQTFIVGAGCIIAPSLACAQTPAEPKAKGREIRMIAWAAIDVPLSCETDPSAPEMSLSTTQLNSFTATSAGANFEIFTPVTGPDGEIKKIVYAAAPWPGAGSRFLGVIGPSEETASTRGVLFLLPDSLVRYPERSVRVLNLTPGVLAVKVGDKESILSPKDECVVGYNASRNHLKVAVAMPAEHGGWQRVLTNYLTTPSRHYRSVVILRSNPHLQPGDDPKYPFLMEILDQTSARPSEAP
jgi:hypothetical protein